MNWMNNSTDLNEKVKYSSTDIHETLDPSNPKLLTKMQKAELDVLSTLPDETVRNEAESDPDCEPLK